MHRHNPEFPPDNGGDDEIDPEAQVSEDPDEEEVLVDNYLGRLEEESLQQPPIEEVRDRLVLLGVGSADKVDDGILAQLWLEMAGDMAYIEDLVFYVLSQKRKAKTYARANIHELREVSKLETGFHVRNKLIEETAENLVRLGYNERYIYQSLSIGRGRRARAWRRVGWLLGQPFMADFSERVKEDLSNNREISLNDLVALATSEVRQQLKVYPAEAPPTAYSWDIEEHLGKKAALVDALSMCELTFYGRYQ